MRVKTIKVQKTQNILFQLIRFNLFVSTLIALVAPEFALVLFALTAIQFAFQSTDALFSVFSIWSKRQHLVKDTFKTAVAITPNILVCIGFLGLLAGIAALKVAAPFLSAIAFGVMAIDAAMQLKGNHKADELRRRGLNAALFVALTALMVAMAFVPGGVPAVTGVFLGVVALHSVARLYWQKSAKPSEEPVVQSAQHSVIVTPSEALSSRRGLFFSKLKLRKVVDVMHANQKKSNFSPALKGVL